MIHRYRYFQELAYVGASKPEMCTVTSKLETLGQRLMLWS